jgi:hypothetical protein
MFWRCATWLHGRLSSHEPLVIVRIDHVLGLSIVFLIHGQILDVGFGFFFFQTSSPRLLKVLRRPMPPLLLHCHCDNCHCPASADTAAGPLSRSVGWLGWLAARRSVGWLVGLAGCSVGRVVGRAGRPVGRWVGCLGWLAGRSVGRSVVWLAGWHALSAWLVAWLVGWLAGWSIVWLLGWLASWLLGGSVGCLVG